VDVQALAWRYIQQSPGQNLAESTYYNNIRFKVRQLRQGFCRPDALRLYDRQPPLKRRVLNRRYRHAAAPPGRPIRLGIYGDDIITIDYQLLQRRHGELWGTHKNDTQLIPPDAKILTLKYFFYHHSLLGKGHQKTRKKHSLQELSRGVMGGKRLVLDATKFAMRG